MPQKFPGHAEQIWDAMPLPVRVSSADGLCLGGSFSPSPFFLVFEGPVSRTKTGPDHNQSGLEIIRTAQDHNRSPVFGPSPFWKIKESRLSKNLS